MRGTRAKMIFNLVLHQDDNMIETIKRECFSVGANKDKMFNDLEGTQVYKLAKRLWRRFGKKDKWGIA